MKMPLDSSELLLPQVDPVELMERLIRRAQSLYTLPRVAGEVLRLTNDPHVDVRALKECIANDPALTVKILRVVNSSLFGLSREVGDLNQAIALLGIKPLKLLVLGFSLPDNLFSEMAQDQLSWYWQTTLTRAVAARELSKQLWQLPGDDAFLAGLLQDIGVLVLLGELRDPYARFLAQVIRERYDVHRLQIESLGFDHTELSATLLDHWKMPRLLVDSIREPRNYRRLRRDNMAHSQLAQILHLAELLAQLVGQNRLNVLSDLLEAGQAYCGLDKERLKELVASLQTKVHQLADVLSLELPLGNDYQQTLIDAHRQMSQIVESVDPSQGREGLSHHNPYDLVLSHTQELRGSVQEFLQQSADPLDSKLSVRYDAAKVSKNRVSTESKPINQSPRLSDRKQGLVEQLTLVVGHCRASRQSLSLVLLFAQKEQSTSPENEPADIQQLLKRSLDATCRGMDVEDCHVVGIAPDRRLLILPGCPREEAVKLSHHVLGQLQKLLSESQEDLKRLNDKPFDCWNASAGVASVGIPPKNFQPVSLLETAQRCLDAAQRIPGGTVKSLEVYY